MDTEYEVGAYGVRAILHSPWSAEVERDVKAHGALELVLNDAKGWRPPDLSFVDRFPELLALDILSFGLRDVDAVHRLHGLRRLKVDTYCDTPIRFAEFPGLEDCSLEWRKCVGLFECTTLKRLFINRYNGKDPEPFGNLVNLEWLGLLSTPMRSLDGFSRLTKLRYLRLALWRQLASLDGIAGLVCMERLILQACRRFGTLDAMGSLVSLRHLTFEDSRLVESLLPIAGLGHLEYCGFPGDTDIADGDMNPLLNVPTLRTASFKNRRHYTHNNTEICAILKERWPEGYDAIGAAAPYAWR